MTPRVNDTPPTHASVAGQAWRVDMTAVRHTKPDTQAALAVWLLRCPSAHPFWSWWMVCLIHLRPIPGAPPAHMRLAGATHEVLVAALDPAWPVPDPLAFDTDHARPLLPIDVQEQFKVPTDAQAEELVDLAVRACCGGTLSPDQDYRRLWHERIQTTAEHCRSGLHGAPA